ncbi:hypothetical protein CPC08DRAFT_766634 [Agrocybe pediades]|nr:hypothetical protein CPC08DRAFT_766634 [Agrocybe pediades]
MDNTQGSTSTMVVKNRLQQNPHAIPNLISSPQVFLPGSQCRSQQGFRLNLIQLVRRRLPVMQQTERLFQHESTQRFSPTPDSGLPIHAKAKSRRLNGNNVRMADLPDFALAKWKKTFLPTLYTTLYTSDNPFDGFYKGGHTFISLLQNILQHVYPDVNYKVTAHDSVHFLAYNRINERRSSIGSDALFLVKEHLATIREQKGGPAGEKAATEWLRWCMRMDGPLFFRDPSPFTGPTSKNDPSYVFPGGRLLSPFIIKLATPCLKLAVGLVINAGYPRGLVALIMAALECAVHHLSKPLVALQEFSKEHWGEKVHVYYNSLRTIPESRWQELQQHCSWRCVQEEDDARTADLFMMDEAHPFVFDFTSPKK